MLEQVESTVERHENGDVRVGCLFSEFSGTLDVDAPTAARLQSRQRWRNVFASELLIDIVVYKVVQQFHPDAVVVGQEAWSNGLHNGACGCLHFYEPSDGQ